MSASGRWVLVLGAIVTAPAGCSRADWSPLAEADQHGRYVGVGIYGPGKPWTRMVAAQSLNKGAGARPIDDQVVLVVADSRTGEIRACGDLTGYCIGMNPWKQPLLAGRIPPIALTEHVKPDDPNLTVEVGPLKKHPNPHAKRRTSPSRAPPPSLSALA